MSQDEVKPSFSIRYFVMLIISALILAVVSVVVSKIIESKPTRELEVFQDEEINMLNDSAFPKDQIEANYNLKDNPNKKVATLFRKAVIIRNSGNEGAENILVSANLTEPNAHLVTAPKIRTEPKEIINAISIQKNDESTDNKQIWNISLLNPGESVIFEYFVYSEAKLDSINLSILPRKKDWTVTNKSLLDEAKNNAAHSAGKIILIALLVLMLPFLIALPFYRYQWNRRPDYKAQYKGFNDFYDRHRPWNLFKPPTLSQNTRKVRATKPRSTKP